MKNLNNYFDEFNIQARIMPALIVALPIYAYFIIKGILDVNFIETIKNSFISVLCISIYYRIIRNLGKKQEERIFNELGAKPTTIILRYSDKRIDKITKNRYHKKLNEKIQGLRLPTNEDKEKNESDELYESAGNWLRNYANNNRDAEYRVYQELKEYNFWRNLYGGKWIIVISSLMIIIVELFQNKLECDRIVIGLMILIIFITLTCLNKKIVKEKAFDYARSLVEVCERL